MKRKTCKQYIAEAQKAEWTLVTKSTVRFTENDKSESFYDMYASLEPYTGALSASFESLSNKNFNAL